MRTPALHVTFVCFCICLFISSPTPAATFYVDGAVSVSGDGSSWETAFKTIQEGIRAASEHDTVIVGEGTYVENIRFRGENIVLRSIDPLDADVVAKTIIDGGASGHVVTFGGTEDLRCVLEGFTIRNGNADNGGGLYGSYERSNSSIRNNVIAGNFARYGGGLSRCDGTIENNVITENVSEGNGGGLVHCRGAIQDNLVCANFAGGSGGALAHCDGTVRNNTFIGNTAAQSGGVAGYCDYVVIQNNMIYGNTAQEGYGGGIAACDGTIRNNLFMANVAGTTGGALSGCDGDILCNLICGNRTEPLSGALSGSRGMVANNTVVANVGFGLDRCEGTIVNCIVWGNTAVEGQLSESSVPSFSCIQGWAGGGEGNISEDPCFVDADGTDNDPYTYADNNYRITLDSPCIDAGDNSVLDRPRLDLDSYLRIAVGKTTQTVDMGAYECNSVPFVVTEVILNKCGFLQITWTSQPNDMYMVWSVSDPGGYQWPVEAVIFSQGETTSWLRTPPAEGLRFYRIEMR